MKRTTFAAFFVSLAVLTGCKTTEQAAITPLTAAELAQAEQTWVGTWSGAWDDDGSCRSSLEVHSVSTTSADVTYSWETGCGGVPGTRNYTATFNGTVLHVRLWKRTTVTYTLNPDGDIDGFYTSPRRNITAEATFRKE